MAREIFTLSEESMRRLSDRLDKLDRMHLDNQKSLRRVAGTHRDVWVPAASSNYVEYLLSHFIAGDYTDNFPPTMGPNWASGSPADNKVAWFGSNAKWGSESDAKIEYQTAVSSPTTDGNWLATASGVWRITVWGKIEVESTTGATISELETLYSGGGTYTSGAASAGTAHTHTINYASIKLAINGPEFYLSVKHKPVGESIKTLDSDWGIATYHDSFVRAGVNLGYGSNIDNHMYASWIGSLGEGDRIGVLTGVNQAYCENIFFYPRIRFEYLKSTQYEWATIPGGP